jgi:metallo-beta-lactamase family protein
MKKIISFLAGLIFLAGFAFADTSVTPYGAAQTVSGSCFLLEAEGVRIIVDCGLFMDNDDEEENSDVLNLDMSQELAGAEALFLTHAHLDHTGRVPLLVHSGFKGKIYSTAATKELVLSLFKERNGFEIIKRKWFWSRTQREKAENNNATAVAHWDEGCKENIKVTEYSESEMTLDGLRGASGVKFLACKNCCAKDAAEIEKLFETVEYGAETELSENVKFKFINAGHIPGSASILFDIKGKKVLFSGDLGSGYSRLSGMFDVPEKADMVFMEATYADDKSKLGFADYGAFQNDVARAVSKGKTIWIPALSFNRTQKVLYELKLMQENGKLPKSYPVHSVSPSANIITDIYQKELKNNKEGSWFTNEIYKAGSILPEKANIKRDVKFDKPLIIISSSGDMDKGMSARIAPTLLPRKDVEIMLVNYVSPKSAAGLLLSGRSKVKGIKSSALVKKYDIFSDHAGFEMIQKWLAGQDKNTAVYLIHSEKESSAKMEALLKKNGWKNIHQTQLKKKVLLDR